MSILVSNNDQIFRDPSNNSAAKAQYSFNKEQRFHMIYKRSNPNPNRKHMYFEGNQYKNLSSMTKFHGKFDRTSRPEGVFININR